MHPRNAIVALALVALICAPRIAHSHGNTPVDGVHCVLRNGLPDPTCTPGLVDPSCTLHDICPTVTGAGRKRPSTRFTDRLKLQSIRAYGYVDTNPKHYEADHLVSRELCGAMADPRNIWAEAPASPNPKDKVEDRCHQLVCKGKLSLGEAELEIALNWKTACK